MARILKNGAFSYERPSVPNFRPCKHCGVMVSKDTAAVRSRGEKPNDTKYYTAECVACRRDQSYIWRNKKNERRRKNNN